MVTIVSSARRASFNGIFFSKTRPLQMILITIRAETVIAVGRDDGSAHARNTGVYP